MTGEPVLLGTGFCWQDLKPGDRYRTYGRTIADSDIVLFCNTVGLHEPIFTDAVFRERESAIKGRFAPGALVFSAAEGLVLGATATGTGMAFLQASMDVKGPLMVGDTIHVVVEILEVRPESKGPRGLVKTRNTVRTQDDRVVMVYDALRLMRGRDRA